MAKLCWASGRALSWRNWMVLVKEPSVFRRWASPVPSNKEDKIMAITLTKKAEEKVREILSDQPEPYAGLRIQVVGGGCSGFQYRMGFDKTFNDQSDQLFEFDGLK